jgi:molybdenum cofactor cytidylyltransferase
MVQVGAILLAAGASHRFGAKKLLADIGGLPLIRRVTHEIAHSAVADVVVVTGCDEPLIGRALEGLSLKLAYNSNWPRGLGSSISVGIAALGAELDGAFIVPGDMPFLRSPLLEKLIRAFDMAQKPSVVFPATLAGAQRNPVLWPRQFFPLLTSLSGPGGAKRLLTTMAESCKPVAVADETAFADVDTLEELALVRSFLYENATSKQIHRPPF